MNIIRRPSPVASMMIVVLLLLVVSLVTSDTLIACPACNEAVGQQETSGLGEGLSYSVVGMAAMPFVLFASVASIVFRSYLKRSRGMVTEFPERN
jgi:hypothetical protein